MWYIISVLMMSSILFADKLKIESINIVGNEKTEAYVILGHLDLNRGDLFDPSLVPQYIEKINQSKLFSSVDIQHEKIGDRAIVNIVVVENWYIFPLPFFNFHNNGFEDISYGGIGIYRNFMGLDHDILLLSSWGYREYSAFKYNANYFKNSRWKAFFTATLGEENLKKVDSEDMIEDFPEYFKSNMIEINPKYNSKNYGEFGFLTAWEYRKIDIFDDVEKSNYFTFGVSHEYNCYDFVNYPTKGFYVESSLSYNGFDQHDNTDFSEASLKLKTVFSLPLKTYNKPLVFALGLRHNQIDGSSVHPQDNIYLNYDQLIRGFKPIERGESFSSISTAIRLRSYESKPLNFIPFLDSTHPLNRARILLSTEFFIENSFLDNSVADYEFKNIITTAGTSFYIENPFVAGSIRFDFGYYLGSSTKFVEKDKFRFSFEVIQEL